MNYIYVVTEEKTLIGLQKKKTKEFLGVPFATAPMGSLRFKRAKPLEKKREEIICTEFKNKAIQPKIGLLTIENSILQSEDCLYLNIWTPIDTCVKKPVVVWIHGGAFIMGETATRIFNGESFAINGDIIFISIQYRLGVFGFLDLSYLNNDFQSFDTNIGLSDQIEALKWIQKNISYFGGDKDNITLMGESAGATSILSLMVSPMAKGLFHKVICQSALVESILTKKNAQFWAKKMMKFMGLKTYDIKGLLEVSSEIVVNATAKLFEVFTDIMPGAWPFSPVIDNDLLPYSIIEGFNKNKAMNIPLLIGTNKDETSNFVKEKAPWLPSNEKQIDLLFKLNPHLDKRRILSNYCSYPNLDALRALTRDMSFVCGNTKLADLNSINQKTYVYRFDYETVVSKKLNLGAFHGIEIMFAFNNLDSELSKILAYETENPKIIANLVHNYWINFIKYANPNREETFYWKEYSSKNRETISLNIKPSILINPDSIGYEIWKALPLYISDLP